MTPNAIKRIWAEGRPVVNGWLSIASPFSAEVMAAAGYDSVTVDTQHGVVDYQAAVGMMQAMGARDVTPLVRVPWLDPGAIMKALDAGAYGIICPMVNSRADAARLVSYMRYPPLGTRSFGPTRANFSAGANYGAEANSEILCIAMVETAEAMENLEEIVTTPGLDGVYVGPADLTLGLTEGRLAPGFDREEPEMIEAIQKIAEACKTAGIRAGLHCGRPDYAKRAIDWGYDLVTLSSDARLLAAACSAHVAQMRECLGEAAAEADSGGKQGY